MFDVYKANAEAQEYWYELCRVHLEVCTNHNPTTLAEYFSWNTLAISRSLYFNDWKIAKKPKIKPHISYSKLLDIGYD